MNSMKSLARARGSENVVSHAGSFGLREGRCRLVLTEGDGLSERGDEFLAVGAGAEVFAQFLAQRAGQFIVDVGG